MDVFALDLLEEDWAVFGVVSLAGVSFIGVVSMIHTMGNRYEKEKTAT